MKIIPIEIDKWEELPFKDEPNKRSVQFRVLAQKINELIDENEEMKETVKTLVGDVMDLEDKGRKKYVPITGGGSAGSSNIIFKKLEDRVQDLEDRER